jgi:hypothetical protein
VAREKGLEPAVIPICLPNGLWRPGTGALAGVAAVAAGVLVAGAAGAFFFCP